MSRVLRHGHGGHPDAVVFRVPRMVARHLKLKIYTSRPSQFSRFKMKTLTSTTHNHDYDIHDRWEAIIPYVDCEFSHFLHVILRYAREMLVKVEVEMKMSSERKIGEVCIS